MRLSVVRKDVARVLTILRDREIALAEGRDAGPVVNPRPSRRRVAEELDAGDEDVAARKPRASRAKKVDEVPDEADDLDEIGAVDEGDDVGVVDEIGDDADADEESE